MQKEVWKEVKLSKYKIVFSYKLIIGPKFLFVNYVVKIGFYCYFNSMLEELKIPVEQLREEIMNVWGRL